MVYVLPAPVWPYARMVALQPSRTVSTRSSVQACSILAELLGQDYTLVDLQGLHEAALHV